MSKIAVDVVLLPDKKMSEMAIEINRELRAEFGGDIALSGRCRLPHISLLMGVLDEDDTPQVLAKLERLWQDFGPANLQVTSVLSSVGNEGKITSVLTIAKTKWLTDLHEAVIDQIGPMLGVRAEPEMVDDDQVGQSTLDWIANFRSVSSLENFRPHITVGYGQAELEPTPVHFRAQRLALCRLGDHCTCKSLIER